MFKDRHFILRMYKYKLPLELPLSTQTYMKHSRCSRMWVNVLLLGTIRCNLTKVQAAPQGFEQHR